jgi:uncharacterized membrane protein YkvA (DUF1232 family)
MEKDTTQDNQSDSESKNLPVKFNEGQLVKYGDSYDEESFWEKIKKVAKMAGCKLVYAALLLYYALCSNTVSTADKALIIGSLGYFILPFDLIPDFIPMVGYVDDLAALVFTVKKVYDNITPEISARARQKVTELFGTVDESDFKLF